ncbi:MAG: hypothetical protein AAF992_16700 [Bacteroidota bacterium]
MSVFTPTVFTPIAQGQELAARWTASATASPAQAQSSSQDLKQVLFEVEKKHDIKITYQSDLVNDKKINVQQAQRVLNVPKDELERTLRQVVQPMGLQFRQFQENYYILQKQSKLPKVERKSVKKASSLEESPPHCSPKFHSLGRNPP